MELDERIISRAIIESELNTLLSCTESDVAVVGGGPSGLAAATFLGEAGLSVILIEKKLSVGGGMWGGGMMFPRIVVQEEARRLLDHFGIRYRTYTEGYYVAGSVEAVSKLTSAACDTGVEFLTSITVEDVMVRSDSRLSGLVVNWTPVAMAGLHVDPLTLGCRYAIDATGHDAVVARLVAKKSEQVIVKGEGFMWAEKAESMIIEHTKEIFPGLIVTGMAANAVCGEHRMGPVFGGMLLSGEHAASLVTRELCGRVQ
ncbi:MAG: sulfide-dependent adenosine diphosphate thiazole synthase [Methanoregulaceae archaeon]|jgi:thiamine thiazole synthase|nr:sulfide-dependent adenosine diphosphate thiazole synthase [Methanoregulaceae archaeon]MCU0629092.1 sulfide-dependent adenosine diphosphate thiazole synthase [Methanoregulaceae archaeon]